MTTTFFALALLLAAGAETTDADAKQTPSDAVAAMNTLLAEEHFAAFYDTHCHKHLRDQVAKQDFIDEMNGDRGAAIVRLFADVEAAIKLTVDDAGGFGRREPILTLRGHVGVAQATIIGSWPPNSPAAREGVGDHGRS